METGGLHRIPKPLLFCLMALLVLDAAAAAAYSGWIAVPKGDSQRHLVKRASRAVSDYYRQVAAAAGVQKSQTVKKALDAMEEALRGATMADIEAALVKHSPMVEAVIAAERRRNQREVILQIIGADPKVRERVGEQGTIVLSGGEVLEGRELLSSAALEQLKTEPALAGMGELVTVEISRGQARLVAHPRELEYYQHLEMELDQLQKQLRRVQEASGALPLEGPGVIVEAADAPGGYLWEEIVHDQDIREIVNSLYHAGAEGVEIGGRRLGTAGWVRCVGPVVVVNGETVAANPIVIRAVGNPTRLEKSLRELQEVFARTGKRLSIEKKESITLTAR